MSLFPQETLDQYDELPSLRVMGIDTASNRFHWHSSFQIEDYEGDYGWTECRDGDPDTRRMQLVDYGKNLFASLPDGVNIFCEEPLALQNGKTTRLLGLAAGAIWASYVLSYSSAVWHWVDQSSWKKRVLGRGQAPRDFRRDMKSGREKEWIKCTVANLQQFQDSMNAIREQDFRRQPDLYDAWAICRYGVRVLSGG